MNRIKRKTVFRWLGILAVAVLLPAGAVRAQEGDDAEHPRESEMDREIRYATGLMDLGLPDFAAAIMSVVEKKFPDAKAAAARLKVDAFASQGKWEQAEAEISKMPASTEEYMSARLLISDRYYQFGKLPKAREGYEAVLGAYSKDGPPPGLRKFYIDSAWKYSQMLAARGDYTGAAKAMNYILTAKPDDYLRRTVKAETADLLLKTAEQLPPGKERSAALTNAAANCNTVMWGGQDILFGKALVLLAHIKKLNENVAAARKLIDENLPKLQQMEDAIRDAIREGNPNTSVADLAALTLDALRESPMSQCKYVMGTFDEDEGRAALVARDEPDAKQHFGHALSMFYTVIRNYPACTWCLEAGQHVEKIMAIAKERGWNLPPVPEGVSLDAIRAARYTEANSRFTEGNYDEAARYFVQALNVAPEYPDAPRALGLLAQCYIHDNNEFSAHAAIDYLVERYSRDNARMDAAGKALLNVAQLYQEGGKEARARDLCTLFAEQFVNHDQAPAVLMRLGDDALRVTNYVEAAANYQKVTEKYNRPGKIYNDALNRLAVCQTGLNDYTNAVATLRIYFGLLPEGSDKIATLVRIAELYRKTEDWENAAAAYGTIIDLLNKPDNHYSPTAEDATRNRKFREAALYYRGYCYSRIKTAPEDAVRFQNLAIDSFNAFLKENPDSEQAPSVLSNIGTLYFLQNRIEEASKVFETLDKKHPGKISGILFVQFMSLMDLGRLEKSVEVALKIIEDGGKKYTTKQLLTVGDRLLRDAKKPAVAQKAYELARSAADPVQDRAIWEPATIGLGRALAGVGQITAVIEPVNELLKKYPRGPYTAEANQMLGRAYLAQAEAAPNGAGKTNLFKQAIAAQATYRQYLKEPGALAEADMAMAQIQLVMGEKRKMLATYQRVFDLKPVDSATVACIEDAFEKMVPLLQENKRFDDAIEAIDYYLKKFPKGRHVVDARMWRAQLPSDVVTRADQAAAAPAAVFAAP